MNNKYNFNNTCPDFNQYKTYIDGTGTNDFKLAFNEHIKECQLCANALEGLKQTNLIEVEQKLSDANKLFGAKTQKHYSNQRIFAYAATILLIIGAFSIGIFSNSSLPNYEQANLFDYSLLIQENSSGQKTIGKKQDQQYMYISNCNTIAYNDQLISIDDIKEIKTLTSASLLRVEVADGDNKCAIELIEDIKKTYNIPVITIKSHKQF